MAIKKIPALSLIDPKNLLQVNSDLILEILSALNPLQIITLAIRGSILVDWLSFDGWKGKLPFYIINCSKHGYQLSYPSGFHETLVCPKCLNTPSD
jgi:hypothetical protein